jgi:hypothetical protein
VKEEEPSSVKEEVSRTPIKLPTSSYDIRKAYNAHAIDGGFKTRLYDTRLPDNGVGGPVFENDPHNPNMRRVLMAGTDDFENASVSLLTTLNKPPPYKFAMAPIDLASWEESWKNNKKDVRSRTQNRK